MEKTCLENASIQDAIVRSITDMEKRKKVNKKKADLTIRIKKIITSLVHRLLFTKDHGITFFFFFIPFCAFLRQLVI